MKDDVTRRQFLIRAPILGSGLYGALTQASLGSVLPNSQTPQSGAAAKITELTEGDLTFADSPAIASNREGTVWAAWLSRNGEDKERIVARKYEAGGWSPQFQVVKAEAGYENLRLACAGSGEPLAAWIKLTNGEWLLESATYSGGKFSAPLQVEVASGRPSNPSLIASRPGEFWMAWESYKDGRFSVHLAQFAGGQWKRPIAVTNANANRYSPALAIDPKTGSVWIAFSGVTDDDELAVYLTSYDPGKAQIGSLQEIARGGFLKRRPNFNTFPTVHCDSQGRVWVAYECDSNRSLRSESMRPSGGTAGNHWGTRECRVLCYQDGRVLQVVPANKEHAGDRVLVEGNDHYPTFLEDSQERLWLFSRDSSSLRRAWTIRASALAGGNGWSKPVDVLGNLRMGRLLRPTVAVGDQNSLWVLWQADNVLGKLTGAKTVSGKAELAWGKEEDDIPGDIGFSPMVNYDDVTLRSGLFVMQIPLPIKGEQPPLRLETAAAPDIGSIFPAVPYCAPRPHVPRRKVSVGGKEYTLLYGNLHEHTLISRCWQGGDDGTPDDDYRYGRDVEGYDFAALTDHGYDIYQMKWRELRRAADFYNDPPHFVALPAYEWTRTMYKDGIFPGNGHQNIIFAHAEDAARFVSSGGSVYSAFHPDSDNPNKVWALLRAKGIRDAVTIPHHSVDSIHPTDLNFHDPQYQTLIEVFQCRQSQEYEGCPRQAPFATMYNRSYVHDALDRGYRMGFVASGDHQNMGEGVAAVLVEEVSRAGIVEALKARRCYGTTGDKIFLDFRVDGHFMGEEFSGQRSSNIELAVDGTDVLTGVALFCNGRIVMERSGDDLGGKKTLRMQYTDATLESRYYYLRVLQQNGEIAWSSPVWVNV